MMFELGKAIALINSARFPSGAGTDAPAGAAAIGFGRAATVGNVTCVRALSLRSELPAGNLAAWRTKAARSIDCRRDSVMGMSNGIVFWILSTRSPAVRAPQF